MSEKVRDMRITFVLPNNSISGGVKVVFEAAGELTKRGHEITVVYPVELGLPATSMLNETRAWLRWGKFYWAGPLDASSPWTHTDIRLQCVPSLNSQFIPKADVVVATSWQTAYWVARYPRNKGRRFYLVQGYETWGKDPTLAEASYRLPLKKIVVSSWLKSALERLSERASGPLVPGVRFEEYYVSRNGATHAPTIGMLYNGLELKGLEDGLQAVANAADKHSNFHLVMFGQGDSLRRQATLDFPCPTTIYSNPSQEQVRRAYASSDIWLCPSRIEGGPPLPSQEAVASGCALVTTDVGAARDCFIDGEDALIVPPRDIAALTRAVLRVLENPSLRQQLARRGQERIKQWTWERFAQGLEGMLQERDDHAHRD